MVLSKEKLILADPYNDAHVQAITIFEEENKIEKKISEELKRTKNNIPRNQYMVNKEQSNELVLELYLEEKGHIKDECHIQGEKDMKKCRISFAPFQYSLRKKTVQLAEDYAFEILGMEEVFLDVDKNDKAVLAYLESSGYENLGEEKGKILFLKEKEELTKRNKKI